jgi:dCMP deaminase
LNCILKAAKEGVSIFGSTVYVTLSPCKHCAALMIQSGIKRVVYMEEYKDPSGIEYMSQHGILVGRYQEE